MTANLPLPIIPPPKPGVIRVVHLVYSFATGGMEKGICTTIRHGSNGFEHIVVCLKSSGEMARHLPENTPVIAMGKKPGNSLPFLLKLSGQLNRLQPAVIHTRNWNGIDGVLSARLAGISSVVHGEHGWSMDDPCGINPKRRYIRLAADMCIHSYTCVSKQMKYWLENQIGVRRSVTQIYNGIDTRKFRPAKEEERNYLRKKLNIPAAAPMVGIVARLDPIKNHRCLFDAFRRLKPIVPEMQLLVVGDGPERKALERIAAEGIRFLGRHDDIELIYRILDVFVLPSNNEGISNTILEAMAAGLPVIASRVGGNPELIEDGVNGSLFPPGNVEALSAKILFCLENPTIAREYGFRAARTVETRFTIPKMVSAYESIWQEAWSRACRRGQNAG